MGYNVPYVALRFQMFFLHQSFGSRHGLGFTERISAVPSRFMFVWAKIVVACIFLFTSIHTHMSIYIHAYIYIYCIYIYRDSIILYREISMHFSDLKSARLPGLLSSLFGCQRIGPLGP